MAALLGRGEGLFRILWDTGRNSAKSVSVGHKNWKNEELEIHYKEEWKENKILGEKSIRALVSSTHQGIKPDQNSLRRGQINKQIREKRVLILRSHGRVKWPLDAVPQGDSLYGDGTRLMHGNRAGSNWQDDVVVQGRAGRLSSEEGRMRRGSNLARGTMDIKSSIY